MGGSQIKEERVSRGVKDTEGVEVEELKLENERETIC